MIAGFGGGPREVFLPFTIAVLVAREDLAATVQFNDIDGSVRELPLPNLMARIYEQSLRTLACVDQQGGETTLPELAATAERSKSTLGRHLNELEAADTVDTAVTGKSDTFG